MRTIVQIIGKPCSGKSTFIKRFIEEDEFKEYYWIDIENLKKDITNWLRVDYGLSDYYERLKHLDLIIILESNEGFHAEGGLIIKFTCSWEETKKRHLTRGYEADDEFYSQQQLFALQPHLTIDTSRLSYFEIKPLVLEAIDNYS